MASPISTVQHGEPATPPESLTAQPTAPPSTDGEEDTAESSERLAFATEGAVQCEVAMLNKAEHSNMEATALVVDDSADEREPDELVDASGASTGASTLADSSDTDGDMQSSDDIISSDVLPQTIESGSGVATTSPLAAQLEEQVSSAGSASVPTGLVVDVFAAWLAEHSVLCNKPRMRGCRGGRGRRKVPPANAEEGPTQKPVDAPTQEPSVDQPDVPVSPASPAEQPPVDTAEARGNADGSKVLSDATLPVASRAGTSSGNSGRSSPTASNASTSSQRGSNPGRVDVAMEEGGISIVGAAARAAEAASESVPSQNPVASANVATWARIGPIRQPSVPRAVASKKGGISIVGAAARAAPEAASKEDRPPQVGLGEATVDKVLRLCFRLRFGKRETFLTRATLEDEASASGEKKMDDVLALYRRLSPGDRLLVLMQVEEWQEPYHRKRKHQSPRSSKDSNAPGANAPPTGPCSANAGSLSMLPKDERVLLRQAMTW
ncbi:hypothetical protein GGI18_004241, partial [Coemansia linderi]